MSGEVSILALTALRVAIPEGQAGFISAVSLASSTIQEGRVGYVQATSLRAASPEGSAGFLAITMLRRDVDANAISSLALTRLGTAALDGKIAGLAITELVQRPIEIHGACIAPEARLVLPDKYLRGRDNVEAVSGEGGPTAGIVTAISSYGSMVPRQVAGPTFSPSDPDMRVAVSQGGAINTARWAWRNETDTAFDFRGTNAVRYIHNPGSVGIVNDRIAAVYSRKSGKLIVFSGAAFVSRRDIRDDPYSGWVDDSWTPSDGGLTGETTAACEMDNGDILVLRAQSNGASTPLLGGATKYNDLNLSVSRDGGETFSRIHTNLLESLVTDLAADAGVDLLTRMRIASSGSYVRILFRAVDGTMVGLVSHNYGASWVYSGVVLTIGIEMIFGSENHGGAFDLVGLGNGQFIMWVVAADVDRIQPYTAGGTDQFAFTTLASPVSPSLTAFRKIASIALARIGNRLFMSLWYRDPEFGGNELKTAIVGNHSQLGDWNTSYGDASDPAAGTRYGPFAHQLIHAGPYLYGIGRMADYENGVGGYNFGVQWHHLGWTRRSIGSSDTGENGLAHEMEWYAFQGPPSGLPNPSVWEHNGSGGSEVSLVDYLELTDRQYVHPLNVLSGVSSDVVTGRLHYRGGVGCTLAFQLAKLTGEDCGVRVKSQITLATMTDWKVEIIGTDMVLTDIGGGGVLTTLQGFATGVFHEVRIVISGDPSVFSKYVQIMFKPINNGANSREDVGWTVGVQQEVGGTPGTDNEIIWGVPGPGVGVSQWRDIKLMNADVRSGGLLQLSSTVLGAVTSEEALYASDGREVAWGGSGGVVTDTYRLGTRYARGIQNIFDPRPNVYWEDDSDVAYFILKADSSAIGALDHDHIYLDGMVEPYAIVDYSNDPTFATGVVGLQTVTTIVYDKMTVQAVFGSHIIFYNPDPATPTPLSGELNGYFIRITYSAKLPVGTTYKIAKHENINAIGLFSEPALAPGDTFAIFGSKASAALDPMPVPKNYMRVRLEDVGPFGGAHRLSVFLAGPAVVFDPPMEWERTDVEAPNVTMAVTKSGSRFAYQEGETQKTFAGRVIGDNYGQLRQRLRYMMRHLAGYLLRPTVLITDANDNNNRRTILSSTHGRMETASELQHSAMLKDPITGDQIPSGDLSLVFSEET